MKSSGSSGNAMKCKEEPDPKVFVELMYGNNSWTQFVCLVQIWNHHKEDNLRSGKFIERTQTINTLVSGLGFSSVVDRDKLDRAHSSRIGAQLSSRSLSFRVSD